MKTCLLHIYKNKGAHKIIHPLYFLNLKFRDSIHRLCVLCGPTLSDTLNTDFDAALSVNGSDVD